MKILVVASRMHERVVDISLEGVAKHLIEHHIQDYNTIFVPGILEIPRAVNICLEYQEYDGLIAIGCALKGETEHYKIIAKECTRSVNEIAINYSVPFGFGLIVAEDIQQAEVRAEIYGKRAAVACTELIKLKRNLYSLTTDQYNIYNN